MYKKGAFFLFLVFSFLSFYQKKEISYTEFEGVAMTVPYKLKIYALFSEQEKEEIEKNIEAVFSEIDTLYNPWNPFSEISQINEAKGGEKKVLSEKLAFFLEEVDAVFKESCGLFDPTVKSTLEKKESYNWNNIHRENGIIWKEASFLKIDLCGIVKGYAVDLLAERLYHLSKTPLLMEWGGEIRVMGVPPSRKGWHIALWGEEAGEGIFLTEGGLATSGSYFQSEIREKGKTDSHILHPLKKEPLQVEKQLFYSVTVKAESAMKADWLSTVLMLFSSTEEVKTFIEELPNKSSSDFIFLDVHQKRLNL